MEHHSMSAGEFKDRYGVTPQEVQDALDENRRRVARKLSEWGYGWAVDEVMCDVAVELLKGGLRRWASYEDRKALGAFVNTLLGNRLGEWMRTERPKYRGGMTHAPQTRRKRSAHTSSQGEALDADEARSLIRREDHAASEGRLCEEDDVFGDPDSNVLAAPAGDRSSYQEWLTGEDQPQGELAPRPQPTNRGLPVHPCRHQQIQDGQEDKMILHRLLPDPGDVEIRPGRFCFLSPTPFRSMTAATRRLSMMMDTCGRHPLKTLENLNILEARSRNEDR